MKIDKNVLKRTFLVTDFGLGIIINSKKFIGILFFIFIINTLPGLVAYVVGAKEPAYLVVEFVIDFFAKWEILLISEVFSIILPLFIVSILVNDQIRLRRIYNMLIRPVKREQIYIGLIISLFLIHLMIGLMLGIYLYLITNIGLLLSGNGIIFSIDIVSQITLFLLITSFFYGNLMGFISLLTKDYGLRSIIIFFFVTMLYDLIFTALGGGYIYLTINYYKISILVNTTSNWLLKEKLSDSLTIQPANLITSISNLLIVSLIFFIASVIIFKEMDIT